MFRIGGSAATGITSGLDKPQKMANGGRTGYREGTTPNFQVTGIMGGYPGQVTQTVVPNPTPLQTALGVGSTVAGLYGAFKPPIQRIQQI